MPIQEKCRILDHQKVAPQHFRLIIQSTYIALHALPGQFVLVKCGSDYDPLLRRPLGVHRTNKEHKTFELLYEVVGKGTDVLSKYQTGQELDILGPLGRGFHIDHKKKNAILVGGGMGVAPLLSLAHELKENDMKISVLIGARNEDAVLGEKELREITENVIISTDDGSYGKKGLVSDILLDLLEHQLSANSYPLTAIFACGPKPMLKAISEISSRFKVDCQVSVEQRMACGIGTCLGCVIKTKEGYKKVCDDGPVFNANDVVF